jgi:hypothetical protein
MYSTKGYPVDLRTRKEWRERPRCGVRELLGRLLRRG